MNPIRLSLTIAASAAAIFSTAGHAQIWQPQSGVMPSYRTAPPKVTQRIDSPDQLNAALAKAKGGEVFGLAPGGYSVILSDRNFTAPVTITSSSATQPAKIGWIRLENVTNFVVTRLQITRVKKPEEKAEGSFIGRIMGGSNITLDAVYIHGSLDNDASNDVTGLTIAGTRDIRIINSEFEQLGRGIMFGAVKRATIANNKVHGIRSDGFDFAQSDHVLIDGNHFSDSQRIKTDHPDAIQFWTARTKRPSTDILIRNNQILQGHGSGTQGIFMRDELNNMPYERVTIHNNLIVGSNMANGITVGHGIDIEITGNTVLCPPDGNNPVWIRLGELSGKKNISGNVVDVIKGAGMGDNKTPRQAGIKMKLLLTKNFRNVTPQAVVVPGIGYQLNPATRD